MTHSALHYALLCLSLCLATASQAETEHRFDYDIHYFYDMRETKPDRDGDITFLNGVLVRHNGARTLRNGMGLGFRNEFWSGHYPAAFRFETSLSRTIGPWQQGIGGDLTMSEEAWTTMNIGYAIAYGADRVDTRLYYGIQALSTDVFYQTEEVFSAFLHGELSYWLTPNIALRAALGRDDGSNIASLATAMARPGWPVALETEYTIGLPEYRDDPDHSDFYVGFRWTGREALQQQSLRAREALLDSRLFGRPTEPN